MGTYSHKMLALCKESERLHLTLQLHPRGSYMSAVKVIVNNIVSAQVCVLGHFCELGLHDRKNP